MTFRGSDVPVSLRKFRVLWWAVLAAILAAAAVALTVYSGQLEGNREARTWPALFGEGSPTGYAFWGLLVLGILCAVAGARLGRSVFLPGGKRAAQTAEGAPEHPLPSPRNPALGIYLAALGLIETTALLGLLLFLVSGSFRTWIFMTGMALLGWLVARPEEPAAGDARTAEAPAGDPGTDGTE